MKSTTTTKNDNSRLATIATWRHRGEHEATALRVTGEPLPASGNEPLPTRAALAPSKPRKVAKAAIAETAAKLASEAARGRAHYAAKHLDDKARPVIDDKPLRFVTAFEAIQERDGIAYCPVPINNPRQAQAIYAARFTWFASDIASIICHRLEHGNPRKPAAKIGRTASLNMRRFTLSENDKADISQEVTTALFSGGWIDRAAMNIGGWRRAYKAARAAIRASGREIYGGDDLMTAAQGPEAYFAGLRREEGHRAARLRLLIRAAIAAKNAQIREGKRQWKGTFRARLADIRAIAMQAGFADCVDTLQPDDTREAKAALSASLTMHAKRFAEYIAQGLREIALTAAPMETGKPREFKSLADMANALMS